ncbi:unnamed protein product [Closterium sp. NIES-53]
MRGCLCSRGVVVVVVGRVQPPRSFRYAVSSSSTSVAHTWNFFFFFFFFFLHVSFFFFFFFFFFIFCNSGTLVVALLYSRRTRRVFLVAVRGDLCVYPCLFVQ